MNELLIQEYFEIVKVIESYDARLMMIKSWGITFSLATLVLGIQQKSRGLFLAVVLSSLSFWILEASLKGHQMRYYPRMAQIEYECGNSKECPKIDTSWNQAVPRWLKSTVKNGKTFKVSGWYWFRWLLPHVMFPHAIIFVVGLWFIFRKQNKRSIVLLNE